MISNMTYEQCREACRWGELHGKLQYPGVTYPTKIGVDPTRLNLKPKVKVLCQKPLS